MLRKLLLCSVCLLIAVSAAALDLSSVKVGDIEVHSEILGGFFPTLIEVGGKYTGITLLPDNRTSIEFLVGGGYMSRGIWKDSSGKEASSSAETVSVWSARWEVLFSQGFLRWDRTEKDFVTLYAGLAGRWENYSDTDGVGYFTSFNPPDAEGLVSNSLVAGLKLDGVSMVGIVPHGISAEVTYRYAPGFLLNSIYGDSDYALLSGSVKGYQPLYSVRKDNGHNLFSIYIANRLQVDKFFNFDSDVPMFAQDEPSLGSKMRGMERLSRAGSLTVVNNFDIRLSGPEVFVSKLYPRINLFADVGYTDGKNANGAVDNDDGEEMFASAGAEAGLSLFDFLNVGYRAAFMLFNENMQEEPLVHGVYLSMQFK